MKDLKDSVFSIRTSELLLFTINEVSTRMGFKRNNFIEMAIIDYISRMDLENLELNGINLKDYIYSCKYEKERNIHSKVRNTIISRNLFVVRVKHDIYKFIKYNRPIEDIKELIEIYSKELETYPNNKNLKKEFLEFKDFNENTYKKIRKEILEKSNDIILIDEQTKKLSNKIREVKKNVKK